MRQRSHKSTSEHGSRFGNTAMNQKRKPAQCNSKNATMARTRHLAWLGCLGSCGQRSLRCVTKSPVAQRLSEQPTNACQGPPQNISRPKSFRLRVPDTSPRSASVNRRYSLRTVATLTAPLAAVMGGAKEVQCRANSNQQRRRRYKYFLVKRLSLPTHNKTRASIPNRQEEIFIVSPLRAVSSTYYC
jgi:hypothetical protein